MRYLGLLLALCLVGCAHRTAVQTENGVDFGRYHRIGVVPFADRHDEGKIIAERIETGLRGLHFEIADSKLLEAILAKNRPDPFYGMDLDTLDQIRTQTSADAVVFGAVSTDRRQATVNFIDTESGETVLSATLRPARHEKTFATPDEIAAEAMRVFAADLSPS